MSSRALDTLGTGRAVELCDADVHVYELGSPSGAPVVLLHGFLTSAMTWRLIVPALRDRYRLIVVDLPGCGNSPPPRARRWSAQRATDLIIELFDALGLEAPVVVGTQMGGSLAAWLAARHPDRVSRLVVMAAGALGESAGNMVLYRALTAPILGPILARLFPYRLFASKWAAAHSPGHQLDHTPTRYYHQQLRTRGPAMARFALAIRSSYGTAFDALAEPLNGLAIPTLLVFGAADRLVPPTTGQRFASLIPDSRLVIVPECGDFPQEEDPSAVLAVLVPFLAEIT
ncbi:alpha/beta fold hydrolase [Nocardia sp. NPDC003979]